MSKNEEGEVIPGHDRGRETTFGYNSHDHSEIDKIVKELISVHQLSLPSLIDCIEKFPHTKDETRLIEQVFKRRQVVYDMIAFLLQPRSMIQKYGLNQQQAARFIKNIAYFMKQNLQFYEFYFLLLESNSLLIENKNENTSECQLRRKIINNKQATLDQWFDFLERNNTRDQLYASLGYLNEIFIPFIKYEFSSSSRVNDYYEEMYKGNEPQILLIYHFNLELVQKILKYTHYQSVFRCLFSLALVSLQEQEWNNSIQIISCLCCSAITDHMTSDLHIENIYKMVKEVSDNICNDKNRTVFAFVKAITNSKLVDASLKRLLTTINDDKERDLFEQEWIIQINLKLLGEVVNIYSLLLKNGIGKNSNSMTELSQNVFRIRQEFPNLLLMVNKVPHSFLNFSNGQSLKRTPLYRHSFLSLVKILLQYIRDYGQGEESMNLQAYFPQIVEMIQSCLAENRWNSILHALIQKMIGMIITTEFFKGKNPSLDKFLEFLIQNFTNKKYVFLNSTRMANQGDTRSLYNICCKVTISFQKACKHFGINNQYEQWGSFVINVLQNYDTANQRTSCVSAFLSQSQMFESQQSKNSLQNHQKDQEAFTGFIDQAVEMKQSINRIDIIQKWKRNKTEKKEPLKRTTSFEKLENRTKPGENRETVTSPSTSSKPRVSNPTEKPFNSIIDLKCEKKMSQSGTFKKQELSKPPEIEANLENILNLDKNSCSSPGETLIHKSNSITVDNDFQIEQKKPAEQ